jgi:hypothetical protein
MLGLGKVLDCCVPLHRTWRPRASFVSESCRGGRRSGLHVIGILEAFNAVAGGIFRRVQTGEANGTMMRCRMVFGETISLVGNAFCPADKKLALSDSVSNPTGLHVDGFEAHLFHIVVGNTSSSALV